MKRLLIALTLTCLLSVSAVAGDIPSMDKTTLAPGDVPSVSMATTIVLTLISLLPR